MHNDWLYPITIEPSGFEVHYNEYGKKYLYDKEKDIYISLPKNSK